MITMVEVAKYSMNNGEWMAWETTYSNGFKARSIRKPGQIVQVQGKNEGGKWIDHKAYVVVKNKKRQGERIIESVEKEMAA